MLCLLVDGTIEEIDATEIAKISSGDKCTHLLLKDGRDISVDETEENLRGCIKSALLKVNALEPLIKLHVYYSPSEYFLICIPISAIHSVSESSSHYNKPTRNRLNELLPLNSLGKGPSYIVFNYPIRNHLYNMVEKMTVCESADYISNLIETIN